MRSQLKKLIRRAENYFLSRLARLPLARSVGRRCRRYASILDPSGEQNRFHTIFLSEFLQLLKSTGYQPSHVVDIGANRGNWTREVRQFFPQSRYTLFEPQANLKQEMEDLLGDPLVNLNVKGVGKACSEMLFTIHERDDSCSLAWSAERAAQMGYAQIKIPVVTLDSYIESNHLEWPDFIKIDAEGYDLEVLEGATKCLEKATLAMVECAVCNPNMKNTALAVIAFMDLKGFRPLDFTDLNRPFPNRVLWLTEIAFVKKRSDLDVATSHKNSIGTGWK